MSFSDERYIEDPKVYGIQHLRNHSKWVLVNSPSHVHYFGVYAVYDIREHAGIDQYGYVVKVILDSGAVLVVHPAHCRFVTESF